jgi:guanylate kinase
MTAQTPPRGRLVVLSAPSGAGKTTLVRALLARQPRLRFSVSFTTRPKRANEIDGKDYFFVDERTFKAMIERGEFLEFAKVFDYWYGTSKPHVEGLLHAGLSVLLEIDWQGARQVRRAAPEAVTIFVLPPSLAELERRLRGRGTDPAAVVERRLRDALGDMQHWREFDYTLFNDDVERAVTELSAIVAGAGPEWRSAAPAVAARAEAIVSPGTAAVPGKG